eukprot:m.159232 g.159232  ORF g.159232 m.159232 type:complete len:362 (-) comp53009_c0_seq2:18-1103(-)
MSARAVLRERALAQLVPFHVAAWARGLPAPPPARLPLATAPTPIQPFALPGLVGTSNFKLSIKRDDLTGSVLTGNKCRKLEFILAHALSAGYDGIITCGGVQSNHARTTAFAAAQIGLKCHLVLRSDSLDESTIPLTGNFLLNKLAGAHVTLAPRVPFETGLKPIMEGIIQEEASKHNARTYLLPVGGSNLVGVWGYVDAFRELLDQRLEENFDDIVLAVGSGGTACGLAVANYLAKSPVRIHAISVCDSAPYFYDHIDAILRDLGVPARAQDIIRIVDGYKGKGYGLSTPQELRFIRDTCALTGVLLDPVYTGKAALGLQTELLTNPQAFKGDRILFVHTGGSFGALDGRFDAASLLPSE